MSPLHLIVPVNSAGLIIDPAIDNVFKAAASQSPRDVFIYSHGFCTTANEALVTSNQFQAGVIAANPPDGVAFGIHWPSAATEDTHSPIALVDPLLFYTMESRADAVGENAVFSILRRMIELSPAPIRFHLVGHSFGAKVVMSALQKLSTDFPDAHGHTFDAVLIQAAFPNNDLELNEDYGDVFKLPVRILATRSDLDTALSTWFVRAESMNIFRKDRDRIALGSGGPTTATSQLFGQRLQVEDLTPDHMARPSFGTELSGHHSDFLFPRVFNLMSRFWTETAV